MNYINIFKEKLKKIDTHRNHKAIIEPLYETIKLILEEKPVIFKKTLVDAFSSFLPLQENSLAAMLSSAPILVDKQYSVFRITLKEAFYSTYGEFDSCKQFDISNKNVHGEVYRPVNNNAVLFYSDSKRLQKFITSFSSEKTIKVIEYTDYRLPELNI